MDQLYEILKLILPATVVFLTAFYTIKSFLDSESKKNVIELRKASQNVAVPIRLQAYERVAMFLERITPTKLLVRISPTSPNKEDYESLLIQTIDQEYQHNISQQIYVSDECWNITKAAKNATIQLIRKAGLLKKTTSANKLREVVLSEMMEKRAPSDAALSFIKQEVSDIW